MFFLAFFYLGCSGGSPEKCEDFKESALRDECLHNEIVKLNARELPTVIVKAKLIEDTMIRGAAVSSWVRDHNNEITQRKGMKLCELLDGRDRFYCVRRLSSPHLKR